MGQLGSNLGNSNITDPRQAKWGDLDRSEKGARLIAGTTRGLSQGFQNYQNQSAGSGQQINPMQFVSQGPQQPDFLKRAGGNPFFYGYGGQ